MKFSVVSVVWNEGKRLKKCLEQFKNYTDDIVIIDTESSDDTYSIAKSYTTKLLKVPFVGYADCYYESALLRAKYNWCVFAYPDEEWNNEMLEYLKNNEFDGYSSIHYLRKEIVDGKEIDTGGWHWRVIKKGEVFLADMADGAILDDRILQLNQYIIHNKSSEEMRIDRDNRKIVFPILINKYKYTKMYPFNIKVEDWRGQLEELNERL